MTPEDFPTFVPEISHDMGHRGGRSSPIDNFRPNLTDHLSWWHLTT
jgi:hypothetical protein